MYRQSDPRPDPGRSELEEMAREGRRKRDAERAANAQDAAEKASEQSKEQRRAANAVHWRFAQRASRTFNGLVNAQFVAFFIFLLGGMWLFDVLTDGDFVTSGRVALGLACGGLVLGVSRIVLGRMQIAVIEAERVWAREQAFGFSDHVQAIGRPTDSAELRIVVQLERSIPAGDHALYADALAAVSPKGSVEIKNKRITIDSGEIAPKAFMPWTRDVVRAFFPKLGVLGIRRTTMALKSEPISVPDTD